MSTQVGQRNLLFLIPLIIIITITPIIVASIGLKDFEKLLLDKNPFAIGFVSVFIGAILFLFHKLTIKFQ